MHDKKKARPSLREAGWWVLLGAVYGLASFLPLIYEPIREEVWSGLQAALFNPGSPTDRLFAPCNSNGTVELGARGIRERVVRV